MENNYNGERIKNIRKALKLNQKEFGSKVGLAYTTVSFIENGSAPITAKTRSNVIQAFNVNPDYIDNGNEPMFVVPSNKSELVDFVETLLSNSDKTVRNKIIHSLQLIPQSRWGTVAKILEALAQEYEK